jgi:hypothetical protein
VSALNPGGLSEVKTPGVSEPKTPPLSGEKGKGFAPELARREGVEAVPIMLAYSGSCTNTETEPNLLFGIAER